ncbi:MAG: CDP-diacylglycerol--glycerol-3-phosphate 3-phosphatidyltransferase [Calditrichaeota bacterium]|nr:MAG: CDP-diacylglycerol--glycerol-3-phosphate 3-phosphatidyltransferase [Calditrichota bacterium]
MSLPNQLTVLRIILTPLFAVFLTFESLYFKYVSLFIFILASLTDWYDGYVARKFGSITPTGKYLDPLADKFLVATAFGVFAYLGYVKLWMFVLIASRDILVTGLRSYVLSQGKKFETSRLAKWKTATQMAAIYLLFIFVIAKEQIASQDASPGLLEDVERWNLVYNLMLFVTIFTVSTGVTYLRDNRRHLKSLAIAFYRVFVPTNVR